LVEKLWGGGAGEVLYGLSGAEEEEEEPVVTGWTALSGEEEEEEEPVVTASTALSGAEEEEEEPVVPPAATKESSILPDPSNANLNVKETELIYIHKKQCNKHRLFVKDLLDKSLVV
jgi:hypothetical protein